MKASTVGSRDDARLAISRSRAASRATSSCWPCPLHRARYTRPGNRRANSRAARSSGRSSITPQFTPYRSHSEASSGKPSTPPRDRGMALPVSAGHRAFRTGRALPTSPPAETQRPPELVHGVLALVRGGVGHRRLVPARRAPDEPGTLVRGEVALVDARLGEAGVGEAPQELQGGGSGQALQELRHVGLGQAVVLV